MTALAACRPVGRESHGVRHKVGTFPLRFLSIGPPVSPCLPSPDRLPFRSWLRVVVQSCFHDGVSYRHLLRVVIPIARSARSSFPAAPSCSTWNSARIAHLAYCFSLALTGQLPSLRQPTFRRVQDSAMSSSTGSVTQATGTRRAVSSWSIHRANPGQSGYVKLSEHSTPNSLPLDA